MRTLRYTLFIVTAITLSFGVRAVPDAHAGVVDGSRPPSLFEPLDARSERFVSRRLVTALEEHRTAPAIVVLRSPRESASPKVDLRRLRTRIDLVQSDVLAQLDQHDFELLHKYDFVPGLAGRLSRSGLRKLLRHPEVVGIDLDHQGVGHLAESVPLIGADEWHGIGVTGEGPLVAILDTGVGDHPDLADDLVLELCVLTTNTANGGTPCPNGSGQQLFEDGAAADGQGHGTHVTGIVTSAGIVAPSGVAPDAGIVAVKVLDDQDPSGTGQISDWIKGLEWVLTISPAVDGPFDVRVVNMSLGVEGNGFVGDGDCEIPGTSGALMAGAVGILRQVGILTVASSGNDGFDDGIAFPSCVSDVLSVGATDNDDQLKAFSNSNANLDVVAPGDLIQSTGITNTGLLMLPGTSQASPHVAACAALRLQQNPALTPDQLEMILKNSPVFVFDPISGLSFPRLWCRPPVLM